MIFAESQIILHQYLISRFLAHYFSYICIHVILVFVKCPSKNLSYEKACQKIVQDIGLKVNQTKFVLLLMFMI